MFGWFKKKEKKYRFVHNRNVQKFKKDGWIITEVYGKKSELILMEK